MKDFARWLAMGFFGAIVLVIVFVKAGKGGGKSGGEQAATIVQAFGDAGSKVATSLEGG
jgi:hypothetical protein